VQHFLSLHLLRWTGKHGTWWPRISPSNCH
jgi:hypothetical protein